MPVPGCGTTPPMPAALMSSVRTEPGASIDGRPPTKVNATPVGGWLIQIWVPVQRPITMSFQPSPLMSNTATSKVPTRLPVGMPAMAPPTISSRIVTFGALPRLRKMWQRRPQPAMSTSTSATMASFQPSLLRSAMTLLPPKPSSLPPPW